MIEEDKNAYKRSFQYKNNSCRTKMERKPMEVKNNQVPSKPVLLFRGERIFGIEVHK